MSAPPYVRSDKWEDFALANRAFEQMTLLERLDVIERMAGLRYASAADRFFEAVHAVIADTPERRRLKEGS